ncbi:TadE/TadG family type IV pilus assembly protein [Amycolatopsis sp. NPDC057786]|uniref:TadE/TadG family type IV pilus assembly protein n=1 Tax=Amycolatopsis sp. NPDC057786 TaxID=3346250 RepID=UPI00366DF17E
MYDDRGAESVGLAVLFPLVLLLILAAVQGGLWWHAHSVAAQAAQAGVDAGRPVGATQSTAAAAARSFAERAGRGVLATPGVRATVSADIVQVAVSGKTVRLLPIPGLDIEVEVTAQAAKERFTTSLAGGGS